MNKRKGRKKLIKIIYVIIFILVLIAIILLARELLPSWAIRNPWKAPELHPIKDLCFPMVNYISHTIGDEEQCRIMCRNECTVRKEQIASSEFIPQTTECNVCNCYCK
jgi:hypothetical protein